MKHLIDFTDLSKEQFDEIYKAFLDIFEHTGDYKSALAGKVMASVFYEPSTRTSGSFQAAMLRLGGGVFGFSDPSASSVAKGETFKDTIIMMSGYSDVLVCRHPREGAAKAASLYSSCPVINAGDGKHLHPTQTLTDLVTLRKLRGKIDGMTIGICGDLKYGRTVHSLIRALGRYDGIKLTLISPPELKAPRYIIDFMRETGISYTETASLDENIGGLDALYMTRVQKERFGDNLAKYERLKDVYILTPEKLRLAGKDMLVLHPLPRTDEISQEVDSDPRAVYFQQARFGMYARMALLLNLIGTTGGQPDAYGIPEKQICPNPGCITAYESYLPVLEENGVCKYCDTKIV